MRVRQFIALVLLLGIPFFIGYQWNTWTTPSVPVLSETEVTTTLITEIEALGKMELVKYRFQEVTEVQEMS